MSSSTRDLNGQLFNQYFAADLRTFKVTWLDLKHTIFNYGRHF